MLVRSRLPRCDSPLQWLLWSKTRGLRRDPRGSRWPWSNLGVCFSTSVLLEGQKANISVQETATANSKLWKMLDKTGMNFWRLRLCDLPPFFHFLPSPWIADPRSYSEKPSKSRDFPTKRSPKCRLMWLLKRDPPIRWFRPIDVVRNAQRIREPPRKSRKSAWFCQRVTKTNLWIVWTWNKMEK